MKFSLELVVFQTLSCHMWLVAAILDSADIEHFPQCGLFYQTTPLRYFLSSYAQTAHDLDFVLWIQMKDASSSLMRSKIGVSVGQFASLSFLSLVYGNVAMDV